MTDRRPGILRALTGLALAMCAACACPGEPFPDIVDEINETAISNWKAVRVHAGDTILLRLIQTPEQPAPPPQRIVIRPDGNGSFPVIGDINLLGKDLEQVEAEVWQRYRETLQSPQLTVDILATGQRPVYFLGEFRGGGTQTIANNRMNLIEAIARAGGTNRDTDLLKQLLLIRWVPEEERYISWTIDARQKYWDHPTPLWLQPYDVLYLPVRPIVKVNVWIDQYIRKLIPLPYLTLPDRLGI